MWSTNRSSLEKNIYTFLELNLITSSAIPISLLCTESLLQVSFSPLADHLSRRERSSWTLNFLPDTFHLKSTWTSTYLFSLNGHIPCFSHQCSLLFSTLPYPTMASQPRTTPFYSPHPRPLPRRPTQTFITFLNPTRRISPTLPRLPYHHPFHRFFYLFPFLSPSPKYFPDAMN